VEHFPSFESIATEISFIKQLRTMLAHSMRIITVHCRHIITLCNPAAVARGSGEGLFESTASNCRLLHSVPQITLPTG